MLLARELLRSRTTTSERPKTAHLNSQRFTWRPLTTTFSLCSLTREAEICVRNFASNCVKPFARQYINLMLAGPTHVLRKRCSHTGIKSKSSLSQIATTTALNKKSKSASKGRSLWAWWIFIEPMYACFFFSSFPFPNHCRVPRAQRVH